MVARLTLAKDKATEEYSTITIPDTPDTSSNNDVLTPLDEHTPPSSNTLNITSEGKTAV